MSLSAYLMWAAIGVPTSKVPFNTATFTLYILPPLLFYFVMAALAITPQTRALRLALWPIIVSLALRATFSVDMMSSGLEFKNDLMDPMLFIATRSLYWTLAKKPFVRHLRPLNSTPSTLMDALDLAFTLRGHGWDWSDGVYIPREIRPSNRTRFILHVAVSAAVHGFITGALQGSLRSFSPVGFGFTPGMSIFDETLPFHLRYLRSSIISIIGGLTVYSLLQLFYDACTIVGVLFLGQDPTQWPPVFDAPWRSTSLSEFWARRWHQYLRHMFLVQGGYPLSFLFGRVGLVIGAFLSSALHHHLEFNSLNDVQGFWIMLVGFGMMAPGVFAEQAFKRMTGRKVCGLTGWVWTMTWLLLWGNVIMDGFVRAGWFRSSALMDSLPPLRKLVQGLVMGFDSWLHTI